MKALRLVLLEIGWGWGSLPGVLGRPWGLVQLMLKTCFIPCNLGYHNILGNFLQFRKYLQSARVKLQPY